MKNGRYSKKGESVSKLINIDRRVSKVDPKNTFMKKRLSDKLSSLKKETNLDQGTLDDYIYNKQSSGLIDAKTGNRIFKEIENNAKVYENEIVKYLGLDLAKESIKISATKEVRSKSMINIKDENKNARLWETELKKLDEQEKFILKSLQQLDIIRKIKPPKLLKPIKTIKKRVSNINSSIFIKKNKK